MADACTRCRALDACTPPEEQLRILMTEDWTVADCSFHPRPMTQEQAVAAEMYVAALGRYVKAFGVELTGARVRASLDFLKVQARSARVMHRWQTARSEITARAREAYARGDDERAHAIESEPTPPYDGIERDRAWLLGGRHG